MPTPVQASAYDLVEYPSKPIRDCHPVRMASIAALAGVQPPALETATVVDLGCGTAGNLLAIAAAYPGVRAIGVDPSREAIASGRELIEAAGLTNITLVEDVRAPLEDGEADYVIAHGVLTWVDPETRASVIAEAARIAGDGALVYFSYSAEPGALTRHVSRWIGRRLGAAKIAAGDARGAHAAMVERLDIGRAQAQARGTAYGAVAARQHEYMVDRDPSGVFHDELNDNWEALSVQALAGQTLAHGLDYAGELIPADRWRTWMAPEVIDQIAQAAGPSLAAQQQKIDDLSGSTFHDSLFLKGTAPAPPAGGAIAELPADHPIAGWHLRRGGNKAPESDDPTRDAVIDAVQQADAPGIALGEVAEQTGLSPEQVLDIASLLDARSVLRLSIVAEPAAAEPGERPLASPLARAQMLAGHEQIASLRHRGVTVQHGPLRQLLPLLDGTRDRAALAQALDDAGSVPQGTDPLELVDDCLTAICKSGFLVPAGTTTSQAA